MSQAGLRVTVIEARPRIGGRIFTRHDPRSPVPLELGAEFVHGEAPETLSVAQAAGLTIVELPDTHEIASSGHFSQMRDFWEAIGAMNKDLARRVAKRGKDFPVSDYLDSGAVSPLRRKLLKGFVEGFYAAHPERLSAKSLGQEAASDGGGEASEDERAADLQFRILNGGDSLMQWLRDGLDPDRSEIRFSTVAQSVAWKRGNVTVMCRGADGVAEESGGALHARAAVITLPVAVLKAGGLAFDPALPGKQRALGGIETGQIFKIVLRFRRAFWDDAEFLKERRANGSKETGSLNFLHAPAAEIPTWWTSLPVRAPLLTGWVGATAAEALLAEEPQSRLERCLVALSEVMAVPRRELEDNLDGWMSHDWRADPFARGAYSYIGVGGAGAPRAFARPVEGTLFFAGEATNGEQIGTVAGALASGRRAARELLRGR
ncbi:MAG TPA: NAD(P)/FAD-dependent oxidoreductase [Myxococcales bacterium]|nr:NAD(P)/FAD-dependent oxidoreductase [Myxococcales bacterium]